MIGAIRDRWQRAWFRPASRTSFVATRAILCAFSLWILLSHPSLPRAIEWPRAFWEPVPHNLLIRFGYFGLNEGLERTLYALLICLLFAVALGFAVRFTGLAAGFLLYHFAPLDSLPIYGDFISMGGLTVPTLSLFAFWAADRPDAQLHDYRWPITFAQLLLALSFLLSGLTKLRYIGLSFYTGSNIRSLALTYWSLSGRHAALWIASHAWAAWAVALGSAALDTLFIAAVFSARIRWVVLPLAVVALIVRSAVFGFHWLAAPLLLLFIDWDFIRRR